jgi:hypothetical protein
VRPDPAWTKPSTEKVTDPPLISILIQLLEDKPDDSINALQRFGSLSLMRSVDKRERNSLSPITC